MPDYCWEVFSKNFNIVPTITEYIYDTAAAPDKAASDIENMIVRERPHVVVCDNKMGRNEAWGQMFLAKLKTVLPETVRHVLHDEKS